MALTNGRTHVTLATAERVFLLGLMAASAALFYETLGYAPASRAYPAALLVLLFGASAVALLRSLRAPGANAAAAFFDHAPRFALALGMLVAYTALLEFVGYYTTSAAMIVALPVLLGYREWRVIAATAAAYLVFVWVIFNVVFQREMAREFFMPWILGY
jgi:putative tricarboxylic transport membrane protein